MMIDEGYEKMWNGLRVRMGMHTGLCDIRFDETTKGFDYYGDTVNTAARTESVADGGQILMTRSTWEACEEEDAERLRDLSLHDAGAHTLRGVPHPVEMFELEVFPGRVFKTIDSEEEESSSDAEEYESESISQSTGRASRMYRNPMAETIFKVFNGALSPFPLKKRIELLKAFMSQWRIAPSKGRQVDEESHFRLLLLRFANRTSKIVSHREGLAHLLGSGTFGGSTRETSFIGGGGTVDESFRGKSRRRVSMFRGPEAVYSPQNYQLPSHQRSSGVGNWASAEEGIPAAGHPHHVNAHPDPHGLNHPMWVSSGPPSSGNVDALRSDAYVFPVSTSLSGRKLVPVSPNPPLGGLRRNPSHVVVPDGMAWRTGESTPSPACAVPGSQGGMLVSVSGSFPRLPTSSTSARWFSAGVAHSASSASSTAVLGAVGLTGGVVLTPEELDAGDDDWEHSSRLQQFHPQHTDSHNNSLNAAPLPSSKKPSTLLSFAPAYDTSQEMNAQHKMNVPMGMNKEGSVVPPERAVSWKSMELATTRCTTTEAHGRVDVPIAAYSAAASVASGKTSPCRRPHGTDTNADTHPDSPHDSVARPIALLREHSVVHSGIPLHSLEEELPGPTRCVFPSSPPPSQTMQKPVMTFNSHDAVVDHPHGSQDSTTPSSTHSAISPTGTHERCYPPSTPTHGKPRRPHADAPGPTTSATSAAVGSARVSGGGDTNSSSPSAAEGSSTSDSVGELAKPPASQSFTRMLSPVASSISVTAPVSLAVDPAAGAVIAGRDGVEELVGIRETHSGSSERNSEGLTNPTRTTMERERGCSLTTVGGLDETTARATVEKSESALKCMNKPLTVPAEEQDDCRSRSENTRSRRRSGAHLAPIAIPFLESESTVPGVPTATASPVDMSKVHIHVSSPRISDVPISPHTASPTHRLTDPMSMSPSPGDTVDVGPPPLLSTESPLSVLSSPGSPGNPLSSQRRFVPTGAASTGMKQEYTTSGGRTREDHGGRGGSLKIGVSQTQPEPEPHGSPNSSFPSRPPTSSALPTRVTRLASPVMSDLPALKAKENREEGRDE